MLFHPPTACNATVAVTADESAPSIHQTIPRKRVSSCCSRDRLREYLLLLASSALRVFIFVQELLDSLAQIVSIVAR